MFCCIRSLRVGRRFQMFDVYLRAYKDTRLAKQLTKQIIDNMLSRLHIGGRAFAERLLKPTRHDTTRCLATAFWL